MDKKKKKKKKIFCQTVSEDQESRSSSARWFRLRLPQEDAVTDSSSLSTGQREQFLTTWVSPSQLSSPRASHESERERRERGRKKGGGKEKKERERKKWKQERTSQTDVLVSCITQSEKQYIITCTIF